MGNNFCSNCGEQVIREDAAICYNCGYRLLENFENDQKESAAGSDVNSGTAQTKTIIVESKSPFAAILLSAIYPGAGQLYNKDILKGLVFQLGYFFSIIFGIVLLFIPTLIAWILIVWEAYSVSDKMNRGQIPVASPTAGEIIFFILFWPIILIVLIGIFVLIAITLYI
ncbi:MAG: zinc-ribbon domain-containing protein [Methanosarcinales archaeon]|jgi:TM2 domain-containing membrane protein YozV|nr:zinc-ribbon domain-containing protein [Methanosarcinales archaeon]